MNQLISQLNMDTFACIVICYTIYLVMNNQIISREKSKHYEVTTALILCLIVLEGITIVLEYYGGAYVKIPLMAANAIGFLLSPLAPVLLAVLFDESLKVYLYKISIPIGIYGIVCLLSPATGWIFKVSDLGEYTRGPFFFLTALLGVYGFLVLLWANIRVGNMYGKAEMRFLISIVLMIIIANGIQITFSSIYLIWPTSALSMLLYYIFLRELQFKLDPLTEVYNRVNFQSRMEEENQQIHLILVMDLNHLKKVNDWYGHSEGDAFIKDAAKLIQANFREVGQTYRIGGDEFCVLSKLDDAKKLAPVIERFEKRISEHGKIHNIPFGIAYGYSWYDAQADQNLYDCFNRADHFMYERKKRDHQINEIQEDTSQGVHI